MALPVAFLLLPLYINERLADRMEYDKKRHMSNTHAYILKKFKIHIHFCLVLIMVEFLTRAMNSRFLIKCIQYDVGILTIG